MLVDGKWAEDWQPVQKADEKGRFVRQTSSFRNWITADGSPGPTGTGGFKAEAGRYRLYVGLICPWASRTLMARSLKGLEALIPVTVVNPTLSPQGWQFGGYAGADEDPLFGATYMHEVYTRADPHYTGRATVPVLWDVAQGVMVNNESADIVRMFDTAFETLAPSTLRLYPAALATGITVTPSPLTGAPKTAAAPTLSPIEVARLHPRNRGLLRNDWWLSIRSTCLRSWMELTPS